MSDETITFLVLGIVVAVFIWDHLPVAAVALGTALTLWATGVLDLEQALAGFGDPTVIFIATLFVVSEALDSTGVTAWAGQELITRAGDSRARVVVLTLLLVAVLTALISVNGSVAALMPVVAVMAVRLRESPSATIVAGVVFDVPDVLYDATHWRRWLLQLVSRTGRVREEYYDVETGLFAGQVFRRATAQGDVTVRIIASKYQLYDGIRIPSRLSIRSAGVEQIVTVIGVEHNRVNASVFELRRGTP